jgi:acetylserotonin O-methyltransferase
VSDDTTDADPAIVLDLLEAFRRSKTMFAAVSLGAFDALASGRKSLNELAVQLKANADALERLLDACVGLRLLKKEGGKYENTPAAQSYLTSSSPRHLTGYINYSNEVLWRLWGNLEDAVREGTNRWKQIYGWDGPIFANFFRDEAAKRHFLMGMHGYGLISSPQVVAAFDLNRFQCLCDLGGATGHLAIAACQRYPNLKAIVFDLPEAIPLARETVSASTVSERIAFAPGDFFVDTLPEFDLFAVGRILHDWGEEKINRLVARIYARLPPGGALLIAEKLLDADKTGPRWAQMQSLNMLTCTEGKERTLAEYAELLTRAGFAEVAGRQTGSPLDAILAVKR